MNIFIGAYKKLKDPFLYSRGFKTEMMASFRLCVIIAIFFYWVEPFGVQCASTFQLIVFCLVAILSAFINWSFAHFLAIGFFDTDKWTVGKDVLRSLIFLMINALFLFGYAYIILKGKLDTALAFKFLLYTFLLAIIPLFYRNLSINNSLLKERLREAEELNRIIERKNPNTDFTATSINIKSNIVNEMLETNDQELLYIKAEKNYINVFLYRNGQIEKDLLRMSLATTRQQLNNVSIAQCHRSYLVNLQHVANIAGNTHGLTIVLDHEGLEIPVSKTYKEDVMEQLGNFNNAYF